MDDLFLVVKNDEGEYFSGDLAVVVSWATSPDAAREYRSKLAFDDARIHGGHVYLRLCSGREIAVSCKDVFL